MAYFNPVDGVFSGDFLSGVANLAVNDCFRNFGSPGCHGGFRGRGRGFCGRGGRVPQSGPGFMHGPPPFHPSWGFADVHPQFYQTFVSSKCSEEGKCCIHGDKKQDKQNCGTAGEGKTCKNSNKCSNHEEKQPKQEQKYRKNEDKKSCEENCKCEKQNTVNPLEAALGFFLEPYFININRDEKSESERNADATSNEKKEDAKDKETSEETIDENSQKNISDSKDESCSTVEQSGQNIPVTTISEINESEPWKITFDLKDIDPKSIDVQMKKGLLRISGKSEVEEVEDGWTSYQESSKVFERTVPEGVSVNGITASLSTGGILTVMENKTKEIAIMVEKSEDHGDKEETNLEKPEDNVKVIDSD